MLLNETIFTLNIICLLYHMHCVLNSTFVGLNLFRIFAILTLLLFSETNRKIIKNIFDVIFDLIIINVQLIFWIGLIYIILSIVML